MKRETARRGLYWLQRLFDGLGDTVAEVRSADREQERIAAMDKQMRAWEGAPVSELFMKWGAPSRVLDDGEGGKIYFYRRERKSKASGHKDPSRRRSRVMRRQFRANSDGIITESSWSGL